MKVSLNDFKFTFEVKESLLERIIYKLDDIDITMQKKDVIKKFESQRIKEKPWIFVND
jgi:3-isopropylmalate dehydratase small subunit